MSNMGSPPPVGRYPTAAEIGPVPSPPPGMALVVFPPANEYMNDPYWYDQAGRSVIRQRHIFDRYSGEEQKGKLVDVLREFPKKKGRIMDQAATEGYPDAIVTILEMGAKVPGMIGWVSCKNKGGEDDGEQDDRAVQEEDDDDDDDDKEENEDGEYWPLHNAALEGKLECVKVLVEKAGIDVNMADNLGSSPLTYAVRGGHSFIVQWLLEQGADPTFRQENKSNLGIPEAAAMSGNADVLRLILCHSKSVAAGLRVNNAVFINAAKMRGSVDILRVILEHANILTDGEDAGQTLLESGLLTEEQRLVIEHNLWRAISWSSLEAIRFLLSYLTPRNEEGIYQYYHIKDFFVEIDIFNATIDALEIEDNPDVFQLVWETLLSPPASVLDSDPEAKLLQQERLHRRLITAASENALRTMKLIIGKYKADVNHVSIKYHATALFNAAAQGHIELVHYLLEQDADIHIGSGKFCNGPTALHNAVLNAQGKTVRLLMEYGGPVEATERSLMPLVKKSKLFVTAFKRYRAPVLLYDEETFRKMEEEIADDFKAVVLDIDASDVKWIEKIQVRRRDERLKEEGRDLMTTNEVETQAEEEPNDDAGQQTKWFRRMGWLEKMGLVPS